MNVLFIYSNINGLHQDCYSFGLASIVSIARANGHKAKVLIIRAKDEYLRIPDEIDRFKPKIVGFSSVSSQFNFVKEIAALIKKRFPDIINVCGGVHPTINPECILETEFLDGIFVGESENSFAEFLKKVESGKPYKDNDNLGYIEDGKLIINKLKPLITDLDTLPYPDREVYPFKDTLDKVAEAPFSFLRGCPYLCSYCSNHAIAKRYNLTRNRPRYRSPESSIQEIEEAMSRFRINSIFIADDIFGLDKGWREEFCEKYRRRINVRFACVLRVDYVDKEFIKLLKSVRCYRILIGIESGNEYVRNKIMNRQMSNNKIVKAFDIIRKNKIESNAINIIGVPGETEEMIWDTIKLNRRVKPTVSSVNVFYPYKGTELGDRCFKEGFVNENLYHAFCNERRETVLNYPEEHKKRLAYYRENWEGLAYPFDFRRALLRFAKKKAIGKYLRKLKHLFRG